jgi:hypothetical protein
VLQKLYGKVASPELHDHETSTPPVKGDTLQLLPDTMERVAPVLENSSPIPVVTWVRCKICMGKFLPPELHDHYMSTPPINRDTLQLLPDFTEGTAPLCETASLIPVVTVVRCKNCVGKFTPAELDGYYTSALALMGDTSDEDNVSTPRSGGHTHTM